MKTCNCKDKTSHPHPHADKMLQYAQDAQETDRPWRRWECNTFDNWHDLDHHPLWIKSCDYRRKPQTVKVSGEVSESVVSDAEHIVHGPRASSDTVYDVARALLSLVEDQS